MNQGLINVYEHQQPSSSSSRQKNKPYFILFSTITLFTVIILSIVTVFTVLKHRIESEYPATTTSDNLVREICHVVPYVRHCNKSMSSFLQYHRDDICSADVLRLSISAAYNELYLIRSLLKELGSTYKNNPDVEKELANCQGCLEGSLKRLSKSLVMVSEYHFETKKDKTFFRNYDEVVIIRKAMDLINDARDNLQRCINGLDGVKGSARWNNRSDDKKSFELRANEAKEYVMNALATLENKDGLDKILFKPTVLSIFASLMMDSNNYYVTLAFFCSQYLLLMLLFCILLRVFRSQNR